jgi:NADH:ubiquinone oxidoreductase subunit 6 (subunit J)
MNQTNDLDIQTAFVGAVIVASSISIIIIQMYKDIMINKEKSKYTTKQIYNLSILSSSIFLIVTIYFYISSYEQAQENKTQANVNYNLANTLSLTAQSIRFNTILKYPETILGIQDII